MTQHKSNIDTQNQSSQSDCNPSDEAKSLKKKQNLSSNQSRWAYLVQLMTIVGVILRILEFLGIEL